MPRLIIAGEPGEVHQNDTGKVLYQLIVNWGNSCGLCCQYDHQIGPMWPVPYHRNCRCVNRPVLPGMSALPFVDYRAKILTVSPSQQASIMGRSNLAMVESGLVEWSDVVTPSRIRSLREVASRKRLTVDQMVGSGVTRGRAEEAWNAVHTGTHTASEKRRADQVKALLGKGYTRQQVVDAAGRAIGSRLGIVEGPSGPQVIPYTPKPTPRPTPKIIPKVAALAAKKVAGFGRSKAQLEFGSVDDLVAQSDMLSDSRGHLGIHLNFPDAASLAGAPDDSKIEIERDPGGAIAVRFTHDAYEANRVFDVDARGRRIIVNKDFYIDPESQGKGIGFRVFGRQVENARKLGFDRIETTASAGSGDNGYYTWPRFGYDAPLDDPARHEKVPNRPPEFADAVMVSDLMATPEGREWWKQNGVTVKMTFDLTKGSKSLKVWEAYVAEKRARGGTDGK